MLAVRCRNNGGLPAVRSRQQGVEAVMCTGVISFVVDLAVVNASAGERSLIHKHRAVASVSPGLTWWRVLRERKNVTVTFRAER